MSYACNPADWMRSMFRPLYGTGYIFKFGEPTHWILRASARRRRNWKTACGRRVNPPRGHPAFHVFDANDEITCGGCRRALFAGAR